MIARVLVEVSAGVALLIGGVWYFRISRALCDRQRVQAQTCAERHPRRRWLFYPRWWYGAGQDMIALRGAAIGMILVGAILVTAALLTAFHVHP
jgi:hypothetical protein